LCARVEGGGGLAQRCSGGRCAGPRQRRHREGEGEGGGGVTHALRGRRVGSECSGTSCTQRSRDALRCNSPTPPTTPPLCDAEWRDQRRPSPQCGDQVSGCGSAVLRGPRRAVHHARPQQRQAICGRGWGLGDHRRDGMRRGRGVRAHRLLHRYLQHRHHCRSCAPARIRNGLPGQPGTRKRGLIIRRTPASAAHEAQSCGRAVSPGVRES
jgi:hypothetical protein